MARPITPEDVIFSLAEQKRASPSMAIFLRDVAERGEDRRARGDVPFRSRRQPRSAACGRRPADPAASLLDREGSERRAARSRAHDARGAAWLGSLPDQVGRRRARHHLTSGCRTIGRAICRCAAANTTSTRSASPCIATTSRNSRRSRPATSTSIPENSSKRWATQYDIPPVRDGRLIKLMHKSGAVAQMQGFVLNTRRAKFADPRVRHAFALAYDFETANTSLFYGLYTRVNSYFDNSDAGAARPPGGARARAAREMARRGACRGLRPTLQEPGQRDAGPAARQPARGAASSGRGRLEGHKAAYFVTRRPAKR